MGQIKLVHARDGHLGKGLRDLIADLPFDLIMAEIGCYMGDSTLLFLNSGKVKHLHAVDTWQEGRFDDAFTYFKKVTAGKALTIHKMNIISASTILPMLDFIYIDGDHSYNWVRADITFSLPLLKPGAIIAGHDYAPQYKDRVVKAVDELLGKPDKLYVDTSWMKRL